MHSSRMRTVRSLTVFPGFLPLLEEGGDLDGGGDLGGGDLSGGRGWRPSLRGCDLGWGVVTSLPPPPPI